MPKNDNVSVPRTQVIQLTANDVTSLTYQNQGPGTVVLVPAVGAAPPALNAPGLRVGPMRGEVSALTLAEAFPGVDGANRVYAYTAGLGRATVFVSHA